ncbi:CinA family nicotinamide mononucleotide deamidase-related protein [Flavobacterium sp. FlaQc-52]|jgi:nicotinamide-nucleotide amidase|uniref:CinA-like protein n=1 Tax=Flavobacterium cupriresistens TaxID=2893885 RepID=A0ABU4RKT8_9FLAO|nr:MULTISPECIES: CinA family nicotinamide mononucleotide deamidase-related protein [unclassified Flavobacterium]MDX6191131.1 CinA family nicotinamide mononucleotide deamidase-related protein [Flavobacterium sp. Fl-318]UFH42549.1 CinA family nicotinamide mononucleotide deamidase-related protein [Flavobacterium sp. F-323]
MKATIITIGDEILIGQIIDTNSGFIAKSLDRIGVEVTEMISISDDKKHILDTFAQLQNKVDVVIVTGGLGPTKDDVTKKTFCEYFDDELVVNPEVLAHVTELIEGFYKRPISQLNKDQALVPSTCTVLPNKVGTAPGMWMKKENTVFISLPGVPYEMKYLVENEIVPKIVREYKRPYIIHKTILTYGQGESLVAERIEDWENNLPDFIKLAYLPNPGRVRLRLSARGTDKEVLEAALEDNIKALDAIIHDIIVGYEENETIESVVGKLLKKENKTIATAESFTGGKIASILSAVPGASKYFMGSVVSYHTDVKVNVLGVSRELVEEFSVVSKEVASAMALGVKELLKTDYAIATTGNAGPSKGDSDAEIGTVFIALATPDDIIVEEFNFGQPREKVIDRASIKSLEILQKEILKIVQ